MNDHDVDDDSERPRPAPPNPVVTAALLGANLVMLVRALHLLWQRDTVSETLAMSQPGFGELVVRGLLHGFLAVVAVGYLWFTVRVLRLSGIGRPVPSALVSLGASTVLVFSGRALLRSLVDSNAGWLTELLLLPPLAAFGHALVVGLVLRGNGSSDTPRPSSGTAVFGAGVLGGNLVLVTWSVWMYYWLAWLGIGMSAAQEPASLIVAFHCVLAALLVVQVWFLIRMIRLLRPVGFGAVLLTGLAVAFVLAVLAGVALWVLWGLWQVLLGYEALVPLLALLAAVSFGGMARLAHRRETAAEAPA
ncbi:hypothetical protein [Actinopolyspora mortivallis]|uniref:hypothetical protein n=1 Tax=Actinopolyspora mortivallis TaxID=33906 RepID=UPI000378BA5D|nr:hypothetical protein [Actinopolyspora mortivallis]